MPWFTSGGLGLGGLGLMNLVLFNPTSLLVIDFAKKKIEINHGFESVLALI